MVLAFIISVAGIWGALMAASIFLIVIWNAVCRRFLDGRHVVKVSRKGLVLLCAAVSLVFNALYFLITMC